LNIIHQVKVLYIEDDESVRGVVRRTLENEGGYEVLEAEDGLTGIAQAQQERPDLVLLDLAIPGMDGYEVATRLKSLPALRNTLIVALTGSVEIGGRERALAAGCDGYIQKPFEVEALPSQLREYLEGKHETVTREQEVLYLRQQTHHLVERLEAKITELMQVNQELCEADRLKSRFIALAAHELRTPLTVIQGYMGMVLDAQAEARVLENQDLLVIVNGIGRGVNRLNSIVSDMVDASRIEAGTLELNRSEVSILDSIGSAMRDLASVIQERRLTVTTASLGHLPKIWADSQRLHQVFVNLIGNAIKYTPDGGAISITATLVAVDSIPGGVRVTDLSTDYVDVVVKDEGIGIAAADQERIFQRFYEARDDSLHSSSKYQFLGGGVGLGLPIARGIAEAHGGWLWVESEGCDLEKCPGSRFHILLPINPYTRLVPASRAY
jgi:signal transduction histidine kinase